MNDIIGVILIQARELFSGTDSFGESLIGEIIEPVAAECIALGQIMAEVEIRLASIDAALAEVRAMGE